MMPNLSQEEARKFIAGVSEYNGGIADEDRKRLADQFPSAYRALQMTRRQLASSIKMYFNLSFRGFG